MGQINSFKDLIVYQKSYKLAMEIFEISKTFPSEEKYSLTDQMRRSSRSITSNIAEAWARKNDIYQIFSINGCFNRYGYFKASGLGSQNGEPDKAGRR